MPDDYFFVNGESISQPGSCDIEVEALDDSRPWENQCTSGVGGKRAGSKEGHLKHYGTIY